MTSYSPTPALVPATLTLPPVWAWVAASLVGLPIGGYAANVVVGEIDSVGAALLGGLIAGAIIGVAQWLALRSIVAPVWIAATSIGMAAGLAAGAALSTSVSAAETWR